MKKVYYLILFVLLTQFVFSQEQEYNFCGSDHVNQELMKKDPEFVQRIQDFDLKLREMKRTGGLQKYSVANDEVYEIPVVVHVIHEGEPVGTGHNKSDEQIQTWIDFTNAVYEGTAAGYDSPENGGARIPVRLVLAKRDMDCSSTTGIVRIDGSAIPEYLQNGVKYGSGPGISEAELYSLSRWDPDSYYNMYVISKFDGGNSSVAGYAYLPGSSKDGTVMKSNVVSVTSTTLAHEVGHAMGLYHPFNGANGNGGECPASTGDCTLDDDKVCDTEPTQSLLSAYPCPTSSDINSCTGTYYQGVQYNIMNYGYCRTRFTVGQAERVLFTLLNDRMRRRQIISKGKEKPDGEGIKPVSACSPTSITTPGYNMGPGDVIFGDINYASQGYRDDGNIYYIDHTSICYEGGVSTVINKDATPLTISINDMNDHEARAYIDYNNDGVFDEATEMVFSAKIPANSSKTIEVTPPSNAVLNTPLRMRVIADWVSGVTISPCYNPLYGQVEDFSVTINSTLGTEDIADNINGRVKVYIQNKSVFVRSESSDIEQIEVYNLSGQKISGISKLSQPLYEIPFNRIGDKIVIIKIITADKKVSTKKVILQ